MNDKVNGVFELITSYKLCELSEGKAYPQLVKCGIEYRKECNASAATPTKEGFNKYLMDGEVKYMEETHPSEKTKSGKWKFSKLPKAYRSAKSVIGSAIDLGLELREDLFPDKFKGKTALEKEIKATTEKVSEDAFKRAIRLVNNVVSLRDKLDINERDGLDAHIKTVFGV
jgi:hypothetical protein